MEQLDIFGEMGQLMQQQQPDLFKGIHSDKFKEYHADNPHIYKAFRAITLRAISKGFSHWSSKGVFEIMRWETAVTAVDGKYKISNNYTPHYARMFMNEFAEYDGFFRTK